jgi:hypothetical protein
LKFCAIVLRLVTDAAVAPVDVGGTADALAMFVS